MNGDWHRWEREFRSSRRGCLLALFLALAFWGAVILWIFH